MTGSDVIYDERGIPPMPARPAEPFLRWTADALFELEPEAPKPATAATPQAQRECPLCGDVFESMPALTAHARTHIH